MNPAVGKSGPFTMLQVRQPSVAWSGLFTSRIAALTISVRLCGGILVAMPTAMPFEPLISRLGMRVGQHHRLDRGFVVVGEKSTVSLSMSASSSVGDRRQARLGVALWPPADRRPPNQSFLARPPADNAARTAAPCAPARHKPRYRRADGTCPALRPRPWRTYVLALASRPMSCMAYRMRRCTGFTRRGYREARGR